MTENTLARLFEHNNWANQQIIALCVSLSDAQLDAEPRSATVGTLRANESVDIVPELTKRLAKVEVAEGATVEKDQILFILDFSRWEQPGGFEIQQGGSNNEEFGGLVETPLPFLGTDVGDEIVGDLVQGQFGDFELVFADQL